MEYGVDVHTTKEWLHWQGFGFKERGNNFFESDIHCCRKNIFILQEIKLKKKLPSQDVINMIQVLNVGEFRNPSVTEISGSLSM